MVLVDLIAKDILDGFLPNYPFGVFTGDIRQAAWRFITEKDVSKEDVTMLVNYCEGSGSWKGLLLLRGLLAHSILLYTLKERRW